MVGGEGLIFELVEDVVCVCHGVAFFGRPALILMGAFGSSRFFCTRMSCRSCRQASERLSPFRMAYASIARWYCSGALKVTVVVEFVILELVWVREVDVEGECVCV